MRAPKSDLNIAILEGVLIGTPSARETGDSCVTECSVATREEWEKHGEIKERTSFLGLVAHGPTARTLAQMTKGTRVWMVGRWCTVEGTPGPRGGRTSSTKMRVIHIIPKLNEDALALLLQAAANPESNLSQSYQ